MLIIMDIMVRATIKFDLQIYHIKRCRYVSWLYIMYILVMAFNNIRVSKFIEASAIVENNSINQKMLANVSYNKYNPNTEGPTSTTDPKKDQHFSLSKKYSYPNIVKTQTNKSTSGVIEPSLSSTAYDLVVLRDDNDQQNHPAQLTIHSYNNAPVTFREDQIKVDNTQQTSSPNKTSAIEKLTSQSSIKTNHGNNNIINRTTISNPRDELMNVSDSQLEPHRLSPRQDDKTSTSLESLEEELASHLLDDVNSSVDMASSNLNEQKVLKELTKIISKGMSGATDQVKLESLENWKRRQKERKKIKDNRAKLFEELITAAINSHPEKVKKGSKKRKSREKDEDANKSPVLTNLLANNPSADSEMISDAENVLQQLMGLASVVDSHPNSYATNEDFNNFANDESSEFDSSSSSHENSGLNEVYEQNEETKSGLNNNPKKLVQSSMNGGFERPLTRQFKRIKQQISHRRKQLDQIKKIFNVELSLNPKDGTLIGKSTASGDGKKKEAGQEVGEYTVIDDSTVPAGSSLSSKRKNGSSKKSTKSNKVNELMSYLKENPEILASVMSELTTETESRYNEQDENIYQPNPTTLEHNEMNYPSSSFVNNKKSYSRPNYQSQQDTDNSLNHWHRQVRKPTKLINLSSNQNNNNNLDFYNLNSHNTRNDQMRRTRTRNDKTDQFYPMIMNSPSAGIFMPGNRPLTAEALLLESLRERQLLNLARLDRVLAEKLQASKRSQIYSTPNSNYSQSTAKLSAENEPTRQSLTMSSSSTPGRQQSNYNDPQNLNNQTNDEILHHFMIMPSGNNQNNNNHNQVESPPLLSRPTSNDDSLFNQPYQQQNQNYPTTNHQRQQISYSSSPYQFNQQRYEQPQQQQHQNHQPLSRFRDWRDVSRSEVSSSQRTDKIPNNVSWALPYDLSTGSSSTALEAHKMPPGGMNNNSNNFHVQQIQKPPIKSDDKADNNMSTKQIFQQYNSTMAVNSLPAQQSANSYADSFVTRPGAQVVNNLQGINYQRPTFDSIFMTRSSVTGANKDHAQTNTAAVPPYAQNIQHDQMVKSVDLKQETGRVLINSTDNLDAMTGDNFEGENVESEPNISQQRNYQPTGQVDYFRSYKNEISSLNQNNPHDKSETFVKGKRRTVEHENDSWTSLTDESTTENDDDTGALWA